MSRSLGKLCGILLMAGGPLALAQQYSLYTVAGGAPPSTPVAATGTSIGQPSRVALDSKGNVYFSANNAVFKIDGGGNLSLVAGNSRPGFSGDGGPATAAQLNGPQGIAIDGNGNIYIADSRNNRVRMVNAGGVISTFAGNGNVSPGGGPVNYKDGGLAVNALLRLPSGVAVDKNGNVYIADTGDNLIRKVTTDLIINSIAGNSYPSYSGDTGTAITAELHSPEDVAVDSSLNVYIADSANAAIRKVTTDGLINTIAGDASIGSTGDGALATKASLLTPISVAVDSAGNVYLAENGDSKIRKVDVTSGNISTIAGTGTAGFGGDGSAATGALLNFPTGIAVDGSGNLYIADSLNRRIRKMAGANISTIAGNGVLSYSGDGGQAISAQLNTPQAVAADASGNFYIADTANNVVRKVAANGAITTIAGNGSAGYAGDGGAATSAQFNGPQGIAVDASGNIYVADTQNARVRKISNGSISTVAGNGTAGFGGDGGAATGAQLNVPVGLAVDSSGNLYIADFTNNRIRKVSGGTITTVAGNGLQGYSGDGGPPQNAQLTNPMGIAVDPSGNLFIADSGNRVVREVTHGIIQTVAGNGQGGYSGDYGQALAAQIGSPTGVAADSTGNLYIADGSARIRKVYPSGIIITIAGTGTRGYSGDGGTALAGQLNGPVSLALIPNGNLYVADSSNNAIRLLNYGGYQVSIAAAVNGGSGQLGAVSPGEVVVFYGTAMGPASLVQNQPNASGNYPTTLAGTTVYFGNVQAPILYTSAGQVSAVVPLQVSGSVSQVFIEYQGAYSALFPVQVATLAPSLFTSNSSGSGLAAALNLHNGAYSYNGAANPVDAGDYIILYATGTGPTNPPGVDGQPYPGNAACATTPAVTIGTATVTLDSNSCVTPAGVIPGLTQLNVKVPAGLPSGMVPVTVKFGSSSTQSGVTIAVSGK